MTKKITLPTVIGITWVLLLGYLTYDFVEKAPRNFFQLGFEWDKMEVLNTYGNVMIDSISHDFIEIKKKETFKEFNNQDTYSIKSNSNESFFRATDIEMHSTTVKFQGIRFLNGTLDKATETGSLSIVKLPLRQQGNKTITTIGDSQLTWREARDFRKNLKNRENDLVFFGLTKDVNAYPYVGSVFSRVSEIKKLLSGVAPTEYYIIFFGAQDKATDQTKLQQDICTIFKTLNDFPETEKILFITLPPSPKPKVHSYNEAFNRLANDCAVTVEKIQIIDTFELFKNATDYLLEDGVHLNKKGLQMVTKNVAKAL